MENDEIQQAEAVETTGAETETVETEVETEVQETDKKDEYRAKLNATNRFLEKEGYEFKDGKWVKPVSQTESKVSRDEKALSVKDSLALFEAKVSSEDFDDVVEYANFKKISVQEALKAPILKATLAEKVAHRETANATLTKSPRGSSKVSGEAILEAAEKGILPEKDEDIEKLVDARHNRRIAKKG